MQYDFCTYDKNAFISETAQAGVKNLNSFSLFSLPRSCCLASIKLIQCCYIANLVNNSSMPITQLWLEASHPRMLLIYVHTVRVAPVRLCSCSGGNILLEPPLPKWQRFCVNGGQRANELFLERAGSLICPVQSTPTQSNPTRAEKSDF